MVALAELAPWAIAIICLGLAYIITVFVIALLGWLIDLLNLIPTVNIGTGFLHTVEQAVTNGFGTAFGWVDHQLGASIHYLARFMDWLWREIAGNAAALAMIASLSLPFAVAIAALRALLNHTVRHTTTQAARVEALQDRLHGIDRQLRTLEREYHGIDQVHVGKRLGQIEAEIGAIESQTIPAIQQAQNDAQSAIDNLYEWAKGKASLLGIGTFTTAIAAALGLSSLAGFLCNEFRNILGRGCSGLWGGLDNLLGWLVDLFFITELCEVIPLLETAYGDVAAPAVGALTAAINDTSCVKGNQAAQLTVAALSLPSEPSYPVTLAA